MYTPIVIDVPSTLVSREIWLCIRDIKTANYSNSDHPADIVDLISYPNPDRPATIDDLVSAVEQSEPLRLAIIHQLSKSKTAVEIELKKELRQLKKICDDLRKQNHALRKECIFAKRERNNSHV